MKVISKNNIQNNSNLFINKTYFLIVPPLFVIEILHRAFDVFEEYFSECSEAVLKDNFVIVYEVSRNNFYC